MANSIVFSRTISRNAFFPSEIIVTPLLFRKGDTKLALYGMSSVKDERLHRLYREEKVQARKCFSSLAIIQLTSQAF
jgi:hypothetical protein